MKMQIQQSFPTSPDVIWEIFFSEAFEARLSELASIRRELVSDETRDGVRYLRHRIVTEYAVPGPMRKSAGMDYITYDQLSEYDAEKSVMRWSVDTSAASGRATIKGQTRVLATPEGCERTVIGEVEIRVPLVGGAMEKALLKGVHDAQEQQAEVIRELLAAR